MQVFTFVHKIKETIGFQTFLNSIRRLKLSLTIVETTDILDENLQNGRDRWRYIAKALKRFPEGEACLLVDNRDLVFLNDPTEALMRELCDSDIVFFGEGISGKDHPWCRANYACLESLTSKPFISPMEINGGTIAGYAGALLKMIADLEILMDSSAREKIPDQPLLNYWAYELKRRECRIIEPTPINSISRGSLAPIYCHGTTVAMGRWKDYAPPLEHSIFHQYDRTAFNPLILSRFAKG